MILPLRQRHRRIVALLAMLLPLLLVVGIVARRAVPRPKALPSELSAQPVVFTATGPERGDLFGKSQVRVRLFRDHESGACAVGLTAPKDFLKPDLLVYWIAGTPAASDTVPPEATLLGSFVSATLTLPPEASAAAGCLILFSLANQEIVDVSKPTRFDESKQ